MTRPLASLVLLLGLAACATPVPPRAVVVGRAPLPAAGLERVIGKDAHALETLFGAPDLDVREGGARKLQFAGAACVLDAYLYATSGGGAVVTWLDARTPAGDDFDRASCIAALTRRAAAR